MLPVHSMQSVLFFILNHCHRMLVLAMPYNKNGRDHSVQQLRVVGCERRKEEVDNNSSEMKAIPKLALSGNMDRLRCPS